MLRLVFFQLLVLMSFTLLGQNLVEGVIVDKDTGRPVPFASVGIVGTAKGTSSNQDGEFSIAVPEAFTLKVTCLGYTSVLIKSKEEAAIIRLKQSVTHLKTVVVTDKAINPKKILRKAFAAIPANYNTSPFVQQFFYRHYCKDGDVYGRLIEAYVDVWKNKGYSLAQPSAGISDAIQVTQLRRSIDKTIAAQGHEPIAVASVLQADLAAYQKPESNDHLALYSEVSNLKTNFEKYTFDFNGFTYYDDQEVYEITYSSAKDSVLTTSGKYMMNAQASGSLFITTDTYAFVKAEDLKTQGSDKIRTSVYYRKHNGFYYPYHMVRRGDNGAFMGNAHTFHIELMSVEIKEPEPIAFAPHLPDKEELLAIPYDSVFWSEHTMLKTTPLENRIINDLGGGASLNKQFYRYKQYQNNVQDGGNAGEKKFAWLKEDSKGQRILYLVFWSENFKPYLKELELAKRLQNKYRSEITFVFLSLDDNEEQWKNSVQKYTLFADGIINYRIGSKADITRSLKVKEIPTFMLLARNGEIYQQSAKAPSDPLLIADFDKLLSNN